MALWNESPYLRGKGLRPDPLVRNNLGHAKDGLTRYARQLLAGSSRGGPSRRFLLAVGPYQGQG